MTLTAGARLGPYEILSAIGAGGMGEVYRAKDTKLGRDVALKILPDTFTHDPERLARFRREAQVLASLNHPHIGAIYGLDEANGQQFLVLELVDGESLDKRIARGAIAVDEALRIAKQIAEALEAAHEEGHHPSRSEASKHRTDQRRPGQGARLRSRQGDGAGERHVDGPRELANDHIARDDDGHRDDSRHGCLHES
jgi:serine/threonine protein kinase